MAWLGTVETAKRYGISERTLHRYLKAGKFPQPVRLTASKFIWDSKQIDELIEKKKKEAQVATELAANGQ